VLSVAVFVVGWELTARLMASMFFPSFGGTIAALYRLLFTPDFWQALWITHQALLLGFGAALTLGIPLGVAMGRWRTIERLSDPYLTVVLATPMSALIPVIILAVGLRLPARALVVFLFSFAVIVVNTRAGVKNVDPAWIEMARAFGASERQLWRTILIPGALPATMTGCYLGLGRALTGMIAVELLLIAVGIGRLILDYQGMFAADLLYATVMFVVCEAVIVLSAMRWLERRVSPWANQVTIE
jgi:ABC-type nitrate/sulfonate/bicarbonate transport system permease component